MPGACIEPYLTRTEAGPDRPRGWVNIWWLNKGTLNKGSESNKYDEQVINLCITFISSIFYKKLPSTAAYNNTNILSYCSDARILKTKASKVCFPPKVLGNHIFPSFPEAVQIPCLEPLLPSQSVLNGPLQYSPTLCPVPFSLESPLSLHHGLTFSFDFIHLT